MRLGLLGDAVGLGLRLGAQVGDDLLPLLTGLFTLAGGVGPGLRDLLAVFGLGSDELGASFLGLLELLANRLLPSGELAVHPWHDPFRDRAEDDQEDDQLDDERRVGDEKVAFRVDRRWAGHW